MSKEKDIGIKGKKDISASLRSTYDRNTHLGIFQITRYS